MARYAYIRVSTDRQSYDQQIQDIKAYGIDLDALDGITEEKMTTNRGYEDRAFNALLKKCKSGDIIYAASTDRIGRDFFDMMKLMKEAAKDGIEIIACKQNLSIARDDVATRIIVAITAIMDEDEKKRIQHRTANKKAWQREQIAKQGFFIVENGPNAGQRCSYVGSPKGHDTSKAREAACQAAQDAKIRWMEESKGVQWVRVQIAKGKSRALIIEEFNELHATDPENYSTREGKPLSKGVLSRWCREINPIAI